jgi:hypothetical protein
MFKWIKRPHCPIQHVPRILLAVPTKISGKPGLARELHEFGLDNIARITVAGSASRSPEYADALLDRKFAIELRTKHFNRRVEQTYMESSARGHRSPVGQRAANSAAMARATSCRCG